jgi:hypothetical protein
MAWDIRKKPQSAAEAQRGAGERRFGKSDACFAAGFAAHACSDARNKGGVGAARKTDSAILLGIFRPFSVSTSTGRLGRNKDCIPCF